MCVCVFLRALSPCARVHLMKIMNFLGVASSLSFFKECLVLAHLAEWGKESFLVQSGRAILISMEICFTVAEHLILPRTSMLSEAIYLYCKVPLVLRIYHAGLADAQHSPASMSAIINLSRSSVKETSQRNPQ